jgi:hypothetical protein
MTRVHSPSRVIHPGGQTRADSPGRHDHDSEQGPEERHPPAHGRDR